ncbi:MAG: FAD-dependent oxidoreductase [Chloroflexi bacterium]|nr:FAD-dependent oxidoreductase [Chloroflexota bacterium]
MQIIVIGAGMAGLGAARLLADSGHAVTVLEARARCGGRVYTNRDFCDVPVEFGAEFIHGAQVSTWETVRAENLRTLHWQKKHESLVRLEDGTLHTMAQARALYPEFDVTRSWDLPDVPAAPGDESLATYLTRLGFTPAQLQYARRSYGNAAGDNIETLSAEAALEDMHKQAGEGDYRILDGYDRVIAALARGLNIRLNTVVETVEWSAGVRVQTSSGVYEAEKAIITLPLAVLQAGTVRFMPELPAAKQQAIQRLQVGPVIKLVYRFERAALPEDILAFYSRHNPPMWWSPTYGHERAYQVVTAFASGDWARALLARGEEGALEMALETLRVELGQPGLTPVARYLMNWPADPYALGGYSYAPVGAAGERAILAQPTGALLWAGEATAPNSAAATVHGALESGWRAAREAAGA